MTSSQTSASKPEAADPRPLEIEWYLRNGAFPKQRITQDAHGVPYVIGDFSWNRRYGRGDKHEVIERRMLAETQRS